MKLAAKIIAISAFLAFCSISLAAELLVPTPYPTIQAAIDTAVDGDTVIVAPGTYTGDGNRDIDFLGKAITVRSESGPENCIIDCNGTEYKPHRGFYFHNTEDGNSIVDGFTIIKGYSFFYLGGDGICCNQSSPKIANCTISNNGGGGIYCCGESSPTITNCIIKGDLLVGWSSIGGIYCDQSSPKITDCIISGNDDVGIECRDSNSVITRCTISDNGFCGVGTYFNSSPTITNCIISESSIGIDCRDSNSIITGCTISDNRNRAISCLNSSPVITDCNITGTSLGYESYDSIRCIGGSPAITNCIINNSYANGIYYSESNSVITDCIISNSNAYGIFCDDSNSIITNCTISDNNDSGIRCFYGNATIANCTITGNSSERGAGIHCSGSNSLTITGCTITGNTAESSSGGGIYCNSRSSTITGCIINDNSANFYGGGIYCDDDSSPAISNCIFSENSVKGSGGGLAFCDGPITNCIITGNSSTGSGGGLYACRGLIKNCTISNNSTNKSGGGIAYTIEGQIVNCTIANNSAGKNGGGIGYFGGPIVNCTITNNSAIGSGGGLYYYGDHITNCILWDNISQLGNELSIRSNVMMSYSNVKGGHDAVYIEKGTLNWGEGNIDADPLFVEPGYWVDANDSNIIVEPNDPNAVWLDGDYHLLPISSCIDAGDPNYIPEPNETDLDGLPRVIGGRIDMGAYEANYIEVAMKFTPPNLNCKSKGKFVKAHITLPEGFTPEDVTPDTPALAYPMNLESEYLEVFLNDYGSVELEIAFDRQAFCDSLTEAGQSEVTVIGSLTTGQYFYATDTIRIIAPRP